MGKNILVAFQGLPGAYSDLAAMEIFPDINTLPCPSFEEALSAVEKNLADRAVIPV